MQVVFKNLLWLVFCLWLYNEFIYKASQVKSKEREYGLFSTNIWFQGEQDKEKSVHNLYKDKYNKLQLLAKESTFVKYWQYLYFKTIVW